MYIYIFFHFSDIFDVFSLVSKMFRGKRDNWSIIKRRFPSIRNAGLSACVNVRFGWIPYLVGADWLSDRSGISTKAFLPSNTTNVRIKIFLFISRSLLYVHSTVYKVARVIVQYKYNPLCPMPKTIWRLNISLNVITIRRCSLFFRSFIKNRSEYLCPCYLHIHTCRYLCWKLRLVKFLFYYYNIHFWSYNTYIHRFWQDMSYSTTVQKWQWVGCMCCRALFQDPFKRDVAISLRHIRTHLMLFSFFMFVCFRHNFQKLTSRHVSFLVRFYL